MAEIRKKKGKGTFVINVISNEHATWQGKLTWAEGNQSRTFRSALELIKLMDEAIQMSDEKSK